MASGATFNVTVTEANFTVIVEDGSSTINVAINQMTGGYVSPVSNINVTYLIDQFIIETDASQGNEFDITLTADRILGNPTNAIPGQKIVWKIRQDSVGGHTITLDSKFRLRNFLPNVTLSLPPFSIDYLGAIYDGTDDMFDIVAFSR